MGKISSKSQMQQLHQNWVTATQTSSNLSAPNLYRTRLLQNITTQDYIQQYLLYFSSQDDYKNYLGHTEWRHNLQQNQPSLSYLPTIRALYNTSVSQLCTQVYSIAIYFDKIQIKLSDVNDLPYHQALYMLRVVLEGFKLLVSRFGYFRVKEDIIFFNGEGEVFVWINPNISSVMPIQDETRLTYKYSNQQQLSQHQMLQDILSITQQNTDKDSSSRYPILSQYIEKKLQHAPNNMNYNYNYNSTNIGSHHQSTNYRVGYQTSRPYAKNKYTFNSVLQVLKDYVNQFRIPVARRMESIFNICGGREAGKIGQVKIVNGKRRSGSGNWGKKSSEGSQKDARSQIDRRQKEQLLSKQIKTTKDRNIQKIHLQTRQENDHETSIINDALPQAQNWHLNSSMFNGKFDQSAVTRMNHHTQFQERRTAGFKSPVIGQPNFKTTQISNSLQVFQGNNDQVYIGSQLDASNTITNRNISTNLNNYNEKSKDVKYKKPDNIKSIYSGPAPIPQRSEEHNRNNTAADPSSLNSSRNSMFAYNPNQKQQKQGTHMKTKTNNYSNHESQRNTANTMKIKNKGPMIQPKAEIKGKAYDQRRLATEGSDHKHQNGDGKISKGQIIPVKNNGINQYDRSRNSSIEQKHLWNSGHNNFQLSKNVNINNSQRIGPTYEPNIIASPNPTPALNYHRMGTHQQQHHQQQPLSGSLRIHPIMNNYNISGMVTSRGHLAQEIKSKYQSPLSTLVEQRPEQRISRTTQPVTGHIHRHPPTQSTSLHRYHPTHTQLSSPNININAIKYMKTPQITITTGNSQNNNINSGRPRQQGATVKPSSVNIAGTRIYATVQRPQDLNNIQMQKYIREGVDAHVINHGLSVNGREVRYMQGRGLATSPREGEKHLKYYSQHESHELDAEIAKDLAQINLQQY